MHPKKKLISRSPLWIIWPTIQAFAFGAVLLTYLKSHVVTNRRVAAANAWMGKISYSIYIWHMAVIDTFLTHFRPTSLVPYAVSVIVILAMVIVLSAVSYYCIERPFLSYRMRYIKKSGDTQLGDP